MLPNLYPRRIPFGMVAGYTFDHADARDVSGNGLNGTLQGGATVSGGAITLNGSSGFSEVPDSAKLSPAAFTLSAWCYMVDATTFRILAKVDDAGTQWEYSFTTDSSDRLRLVLANLTLVNRIDLFSTAAQTSLENSWHHFASTWSGGTTTTAIALYIDGAVVTSTSSFTAGSYAGASNGTGSLRIGKDNSTLANGKITDVRIYDRALTAAEIAQIYQNTRSRYA